MATEPTEILFERVLGYQNDLIGFFTGSSLEGELYSRMRTDLLRNPAFNDLAPAFLKRCRDTGALWSFAKSVDPSWEPRRQFLREQFEPLLGYLETPQPSFSGPYDAAAWTGVQSRQQQALAVKTLIPLAQSAIETLINHLEAPGHNGGPILDEAEDALASLRCLHRKLGEVLQAAEDDQLSSTFGQGLLAEAARYGKRAAKALKSDPVPYALSAVLLGCFTACGMPGIGGYLSGLALAVQKASSDPLART